MADQNPQSPERNIAPLPDEKDEMEIKRSLGSIVDTIIRLLALSLLFYWCFRILEPFISVVLSATVLAVAIYPVFKSLKKIMLGKDVIAASVISLLFLSILVAPAIWMIIATGEELKNIGQQVKDGNVAIPPPNEDVKSFPIVGNAIYDIWVRASTNLQEVVLQFKDQIKSVGGILIQLIASTGKGILLLAASIIVCGVLLAFGGGAGNFARSLFIRIAGERGLEMVSVAEVTIRNVTRGILGVAFIQALLAGGGMFLAGIPLAGLWTLACLILAVMQIGLLPVTLGVIIYAWTSTSTVTAILITIWMGFVGVVDNILKPIMLGKNAPVPMLIVFLGAIGGFIYSGFIGLFTGAIVLSLGYKFFVTWIYHKETIE